MVKTFKLLNLGCANCAARMERAINKLPQVKSASISFMTHRLVIEAADEQYDAALEKAQEAIRIIEKDCVIVR